MNNVIRLKHRSLLYAYFAYVDTADYHADPLFVRNQCRVHYDREYQKQGTEYRVILCHVRKRDKQRFLDALAALKNKMAVLGYRDYGGFCGDFLPEPT